MKELNELQEALELINEAKARLEVLQKSGGSLNNYYGYSINLMVQQLCKIADNSMGYLTNDCSLNDIIQTYGKHWGDDRLLDDIKQALKEGKLYYLDMKVKTITYYSHSEGIDFEYIGSHDNEYIKVHEAHQMELESLTIKH